MICFRSSESKTKDQGCLDSSLTHYVTFFNSRIPNLLTYFLHFNISYLHGGASLTHRMIQFPCHLPASLGFLSFWVDVAVNLCVQERQHGICTSFHHHFIPGQHFAEGVIISGWGIIFAHECECTTSISFQEFRRVESRYSPFEPLWSGFNCYV